MKSFTVPSAPFVPILLKRKEELEQSESPGPLAELQREIGISERLLRRILNAGQEQISFDTADRIVTYLVGPMAWWTDETLNEIYMSVDLAAMDSKSPVAKAAA